MGDNIIAIHRYSSEVEVRFNNGVRSYKVYFIGQIHSENNEFSTPCKLENSLTTKNSILFYVFWLHQFIVIVEVLAI